jgi:hypothetical protein
MCDLMFSAGEYDNIKSHPSFDDFPSFRTQFKVFSALFPATLTVSSLAFSFMCGSMCSACEYDNISSFDDFPSFRTHSNPFSSQELSKMVGRT